MREEAAWVIDNLSVARCLLRNNHSAWRSNIWHAVHPGTGKIFCAYGRGATELCSHKLAVPEDVTCTYCRRAVDIVARIAKGE